MLAKQRAGPSASNKKRCKNDGKLGKVKDAESKHDSIKVVVRCRPMNSSERDECADTVIQEDNSQKCLSIRNKRRQLTGNSRRFTFDTVYGMHSTQTEIYENSVRAMVNHMLNGYNVTIFAYGQTGAGKTFTMEGNQAEHGIMQRAFKQIFEFTKREKKLYKCIIECCYLELYQGKLRDLLTRSEASHIDTRARPTLPCKGQRSITCRTIEQIERCRKRGHRIRRTASTYFNDHSSRSHAIFTITITKVSLKTGEPLVRSKLNLVDLAGSECLQRSNATDQRLKECCDINLSLLAVNKVITSTMAGKSYIPYRDSLLTQLLQDSFGGNSKTLMIANIGPVASKETLITLEYANRAKKIKNAPNINFHHKENNLEHKYEAAMEELELVKTELEKERNSKNMMKTKMMNMMRSTVVLLDHMAGLVPPPERSDQSG